MTADPTAIDIDVDPRTARMSGVAVHGDTPFDVPFITQIDGNIWQGGCQDGMVLPHVIKHLVSLYPWESYGVAHELSSVLAVRMYDSIEQAFGQVEAIAKWVLNCAEDGPTLVHCQAGLNRSSLVVGQALILKGMTGRAAVDLIREKRSPACLCNPSFEKWLTG